MDHGLSTRWCAHEDAAFDIEEVSVLQDAFGLSMGRDALVLDLDPDVPEGGRWRVARVDVLAMVPRDTFDTYTDGQQVTVEIWSGSDPTVGEPWAVRQTFETEGLAWEDAWIPDGTFATDPHQRRAWWGFDFSEVVPSAGMGPEETVVVSVGWGLRGEPTLGYSNYELPCDQNWTDHGDGFVHNSESPRDETCSWPMFRVAVEVQEASTTCEDGTWAVE